MPLNSQQIESTVTTLGTRLRKARKLRKMSQSQLARQIRTSPNQISMIENGQSGTSIRTMVAAASALNVSLDFLAGLSDNPRPSRQIEYVLKTKEAEIFDLQSGRQDFSRLEDYVMIEASNIQSAAGAGAVVHDEGVMSTILFPWSWLREHGLQPERCRVIEVVGQSMEPTLADGSKILIDLTNSGRRSGEIYVTRIENELIVKRVIHDRKAGWLLVSDNPDKATFPTRVWADDARVVAEVKWYGQSFT